jgi:Astacin (Peptidase family M12A)
LRAAFVILLLILGPLDASAQEVIGEGVGQETALPEGETHEALVDLFGTLQVVTYTRVGDVAVMGGDMALGSHAEMQLKTLTNAASLLKKNLDLSPNQSDQFDEFVEQLAKVIEPSDGARAAISSGAALWPNKTIEYTIAGTIINDDLVERIEGAVAYWNSNSEIKLVPAQAKHRRILRFEDAEGTEWNCYAQVGFRAGSGGFIKLNPPCTSGAIVHEIGHALGMMHEHSRPIRDVFLYVAPEVAGISNYRAHRSTEFETDYDLCSIMHYGPRQIPAGTTEDWFVLTDAGEEAFASCSQQLPKSCRNVGQRCMLSMLDRALIYRLYEGRD